MSEVVFDCRYESGAELIGQTFCPSVLNGSPLVDYQARLSDQVTSKPFPWWLLIVAAVVVWNNSK